MNIVEGKPVEEVKHVCVMKRSGKRVPFDKNKIIAAITSANNEVGISSEKLTKREIEKIASEIEISAQHLGRDLSVEEIQDKIEDALMDLKKFQLARLYITYRYKHNEKRKMSDIDQKIAGVIENKNDSVKTENSNKNPTILSVQRDYMAGEWSRYYTEKYLMPEDIATANKEGIIHVHDMDYISQHMSNCFSGHTKLITSRGVKKFNSFHDGDHIYVRDRYGIFREATVHTYGKQQMYDIVLTSGRYQYKVSATRNHRWILQDGTVTTNLQVGDSIVYTPNAVLPEIESDEDAFAFCIGFIVGDGSDESYNNGCTKVRLCGKKIKYLDTFLKAGFTAQNVNNSNDKIMYYSMSLKQDFINGQAWKYLPLRSKILAFVGYLAADGAVSAHSISTSDERLYPFIEDIGPVAGYYITGYKDITHDTNYCKGAHLRTYQYITNHSWAYHLTVKSITKTRHIETAWCVEEPITHSFTLNNGIVTGNCCLVNLEDMLQNGTCISGTWIDKPKSFATACTVTSQIVAQVASSQYGGQTITLSHLAPFVDISRQKILKRLKSEFESVGIQTSDEKLHELAEKEVRKEIEAGCQTIQYQLITLQSTNGQAAFVTTFMYLHEVPEGQTRDDLATIIEVMLKQRILGVKDTSGAYITPAFPKIIYVLEDDNIEPGSKYYYLTELAAKCTAKRMVPDYISEKKMMELKGDVYPCIKFCA